MTRYPESIATLPAEVEAWYVERGAALDERPGASVKPLARALERRRAGTRRPYRLLSLATIAVALAAWWLATAIPLVPPLFLPPPASVAASFAKVATEGFADATLLQHLAASFARLFVALALTIAIGVPGGILAGMSRTVRAVTDPLIEFFRPIPPLAYLPLVIIWCGIGEASKVLVLWLAMFPAVLLSTAAGVKTVSEQRVDAARALGATPFQVMRFVVLPSALPSILTGIRIGLGGGWSTLVAAELIAATRGIGFMIESAAQFLVTDVVVMGIFVIAGVAFMLEMLVRIAERVLVPWYGKA